MKTFFKTTLCILFLFFSCQQNEETYFEKDNKNHLLTLQLQIDYPDSSRYDSAVITFTNYNIRIVEKLTLNNSAYAASGVISDLFPGSWNISTSFYTTVEPKYKSLEKNTVSTFEITTRSKELKSTRSFAVIRDGSDPISIRWDEYYYYQLYLPTGNPSPDAFVRLPVDPTNPFVEVRTTEQEWIYVYIDRSFYNSSLDGSSNHYQGGGAFEIYGKYGDTYDRLSQEIIDNTSLLPGISEVVNKEWNLADCIVVLAGLATDQELLLYHVWN